jgi:beta-1,4-mannosyltransferase
MYSIGKMKQIKSIFVPRAGDENPYQNQLLENLKKLDVKVERPGFGEYFFLATVISHWKPDIIHFHWLSPLYLSSNRLKAILRSTIFVIQLIVIKVLRIKIIWTVHNLKNHENLHLNLDNICSKIVAKSCDAIIAHSEAAKNEIIIQFSVKNKNKIFVVPHGNYINCYDNKIDCIDARKKLKLNDSSLVFLFFGLIRPYKGVFELIDTFKTIPNENIQLVIAGKIYGETEDIKEQLEQKVIDDKRINFIPGFVADKDIQIYMNASDILVFPYKDILTSGAVLLAMSFGRACIAPIKGCIGEVLDDRGAFLYDMEEEKGLLKSMNYAIQKQPKLQSMGEHNRYLAEQYNWEKVAEMTLDIYHFCLDKTII